jgi:hypothetical protein
MVVKGWKTAQLVGIDTQETAQAVSRPHFNNELVVVSLRCF